jgi:ADP-ribose pyrophosphatase YjhB (NUDIX family)
MFLSARTFFALRGWRRNGVYTQQGLHQLAELVTDLPTVWGGKWGPLFTPFMGKVVPLATELVVIEGERVLLTHRRDKYFTGWHTPGSYTDPGEDWQKTCTRIAERELGCDVKFVRILHVFSNVDNPRFHDVTALALCRLVGKPQKGLNDPEAGTSPAWFSEKPSGLIPVHDKYWPVIEAELRR